MANRNFVLLSTLVVFVLFLQREVDAHFRIRNWLTDENVSVRVTKGYVSLNNENPQNITESSEPLIVKPDSEIFLVRDPEIELAIKVSRVTLDGKTENPVLTYECKDGEKCEKVILDEKYNQDTIQPHFYPPIYIESIEKN